MQQGVQMDATCNIQQRWELLANNVASVCMGRICPTKHEIKKFHVVVVQQWQRNVRDACAKLLFCQSKPIAF